MALYRWPDCPAPVREQVERLLAGVQALVSPGLDGAYLHGSLAMGCPAPVPKDIDLLFVTRAPLAVPVKRALATLLLAESGRPSPLEVHFLAWEHLWPWRFPPPFELCAYQGEAAAVALEPGALAAFAAAVSAGVERLAAGQGSAGPEA